MPSLKHIDFRAGWDELQGLDWKNPGAWSQWIYYFFYLVAVVAVLFAANYFEWSPARASLHRDRKQEVTLKRTFEGKAAEAASLKEYTEQLAEMKREFGSMLQQLPSRSEIAGLLKDISNARVAAGLNAELFEPKPEVMHNFYASVPNQITVTGTYDQMAEFVDAVAALPRIVTLGGIEMKPVGGKAAPDELSMSAEADTYRYLSAEEQAQQAAQADASKSGKGAHPPAKGGHR